MALFLCICIASYCLCVVFCLGSDRIHVNYGWALLPCIITLPLGGIGCNVDLWLKKKSRGIFFFFWCLFYFIENWQFEACNGAAVCGAAHLPHANILNWFNLSLNC